MLEIYFKDKTRDSIKTNQNFRLDTLFLEDIEEVSIISAIGNSKRHVEEMFGLKIENEMAYFTGDLMKNILLNW